MNAQEMRNTLNARFEAQITNAITVGKLREMLEGLADDTPVWVDIDHDVIRTPIDQYWHSTAKAIGIQTMGDNLVLYIGQVDPLDDDAE